MIFVVTDLSEQAVLIEISMRDFFKRIRTEMFPQGKACYLDMIGFEHRSIISEATLRVSEAIPWISEATLRVSDTLIIMIACLFTHPRAMMGRQICLARGASPSIMCVSRPWGHSTNQPRLLGWRGRNAVIRTQAESCSKHNAICTG